MSKREKVEEVVAKARERAHSEEKDDRLLMA